jgi:hypothetical protein
MPGRICEIRASEVSFGRIAKTMKAEGIALPANPHTNRAPAWYASERILGAIPNSPATIQLIIRYLFDSSIGYLNVLCFGGRTMGIAVAWDCTTNFLGARFSGEDRHRRRLAKVTQLETSTIVSRHVRG